jgi:hypothetical protein
MTEKVKENGKLQAEQLEQEPSKHQQRQSLSPL